MFFFEDSEKSAAVQNNKREYLKAESLYASTKRQLKKLNDKIKEQGSSDLEYYDNIAIRDTGSLQETVNYFDYLIRQERLKQDEPMYNALV